MIVITNYFDFTRIARDNVENEGLDVLVCGNTFTDYSNPYPTIEVNDYLKKSGHNSSLAEENKEGDEDYPKNLPDKVTRMANDCDIVVLLVSPIGGVATEIPIMATAYPEKTIFCIKKDDKVGSMIEGYICGNDKTKLVYETNEQLFELLHEELRSRKLIIRVKRRLVDRLYGR